MFFVQLIRLLEKTFSHGPDFPEPMQCCLDPALLLFFLGAGEFEEKPGCLPSFPLSFLLLTPFCSQLPLFAFFDVSKLSHFSNNKMLRNDVITKSMSSNPCLHKGIPCRILNVDVWLLS